MVRDGYTVHNPIVEDTEYMSEGAVVWFSVRKNRYKLSTPLG